MKRIAACMLACILLMLLGAIAEQCSHEQLRPAGTFTQCEDLEYGHQKKETSTSVCEDCGKKVVRSSYGALMGHTFYMSESIHFEEDGIHLCVFICPDCRHVRLVEYACTGGRQCYVYRGQESESFPAQTMRRRSELQELTEQDYLERWLSVQEAQE